MTDDIVARLRNAPWTTADECNAAADEIERLRSLWSEQKSQAMTLFDENRILREEIASLRQTIERSQQVSIEWIRETQSRARIIDGKLE